MDNGEFDEELQKAAQTSLEYLHRVVSGELQTGKDVGMDQMREAEFLLRLHLDHRIHVEFYEAGLKAE